MASTVNISTLNDLDNPNLDEGDIAKLLFNLTGCMYGFATSSQMRWGKDGIIHNMGSLNPDGFYQIMPDSIDDGFFDWYCYHRDEQQFFTSKESATLQFIFYWMKWQGLGKPKPF